MDKPMEWPPKGYKPVQSKTVAKVAVPVETRFIVPDVHVPAHDRKAWAVTLGVLRDLKPDKGFIMGDFLNLASLSHHPKSKPDIVRLSEELYQGNICLDELQNASPSTRWVCLEGNHEGWAKKFAAEYGSLDGMLEVDVGLYMRERDNGYRRGTSELRGIRWVSLREQNDFKDGPVAYLHGVNESKHHAAFHAEVFAPRVGARHVVYAHLHTMQAFSSAAGYTAQCCGFLGDESLSEFSYTRGRPTTWVQGFLVQQVAGDNVTTTPVRIQGGRALYGGQVYAQAKVK